MKINRIRRASYQMIYDCRVGSFVIPPGSRLGGALISHTLIDHTWHAQGKSLERGILLPQLRDQDDSVGGLARKKNREENKFSSRVEGWILVTKDFRGRDQAWGLNASFS